MAKCGCERSANGECTGLHKLSEEEWTSLVNSNYPTVTVIPKELFEHKIGFVEINREKK